MASHFLPRAALSEQFEYLFQALDLPFGLRLMFLECRPELIGLRRLRHFWKGLLDLFLGVVDVLERIEKQVAEVFLSHDVLHCWQADNMGLKVRFLGCATPQPRAAARSISAIPRSARFFRRSVAGTSVKTTSSVGLTVPASRWPPRVEPSASPSTIWT